MFRSVKSYRTSNPELYTYWPRNQTKPNPTEFIGSQHTNEDNRNHCQSEALLVQWKERQTEKLVNDNRVDDARLWNDSLLFHSCYMGFFLYELQMWASLTHGDRSTDFEFLQRANMNLLQIALINALCISDPSHSNVVMPIPRRLYPSNLWIFLITIHPNVQAAAFI